MARHRQSDGRNIENNWERYLHHINRQENESYEDCSRSSVVFYSIRISVHSFSTNFIPFESLLYGGHFKINRIFLSSLVRKLERFKETKFYIFLQTLFSTLISHEKSIFKSHVIEIYFRSEATDFK